VGSVPPALASGFSSPQGRLALAAASVTALMALTFAPVLLPGAIALYGAELVVAVHRGALEIWSIPLFALVLTFVYEAGEVRHRVPPGAVVEPRPLRGLARRLALSAALGALAAVTVLAATAISSRGGPTALIVGSVFAAGAALLVRMLTPR
jgi:hypothetical protein